MAKHSSFITNTGYRPEHGRHQRQHQQRDVGDANEFGGLGHLLVVGDGVMARLMAQASLPNRPAGRIISTMTMMTNTTMLEASG